MINIRERIEESSRASRALREPKRRFWLIVSCVSIALYAVAGLFTVWVLAR